MILLKTQFIIDIITVLIISSFIISIIFFAIKIWKYQFTVILLIIIAWILVSIDWLLF